jgi:protein-L-isoaspartate(D-aspartate) O-methyltransferase
MDRTAELGIIRSAYAKQIMAAARVSNPRVERAFAAVCREQFLGPGPWSVCRWRGEYVPTPTADPVYLYTDDLVGIAPERHINNGQPSFHAAIISSAMPVEGEHVVHIGAGVGYYTAIFAHLVGSSGRVTAIELEVDLAARCEANFSSYSNVQVIQGDGAAVSFDAADVIYVNAGATRPADLWLDGLAKGGRLILPLTTSEGFGFNDLYQMETKGTVFQIERRGGEFLARWISSVAIFPCEGGRDEASEHALASALNKGGWQHVTRLYRHEDVPEDRCWLRGQGWCLAYA